MPTSKPPNYILWPLAPYQSRCNTSTASPTQHTKGDHHPCQENDFANYATLPKPDSQLWLGFQLQFFPNSVSPNSPNAMGCTNYFGYIWSRNWDIWSICIIITIGDCSPRSSPVSCPSYSIVSANNPFAGLRIIWCFFWLGFKLSHIFAGLRIIWSARSGFWNLCCRFVERLSTVVGCCHKCMLSCVILGRSPPEDPPPPSNPVA